MRSTRTEASVPSTAGTPSALQGERSATLVGTLVVVETPPPFSPRMTSSARPAPTGAPSLAWLLLGAAVPALAAGAVVEFLPRHDVSLEIIAALLLAACVAGAVRARAQLLSPAYRLRVPLLLALSVGVAGLFPLLAGMAPRNYAVFGSVAPTLMGWAIFFWILGSRDDAPGLDLRAWSPPRWAVPLLVATSVALLATVHWLAVGSRAIVSDEVIYLLQSEWMWNRGYAWHIDRDLLPFFAMRKLGITPTGGLYGQYTPGWPLVLALFDLVGLRWWSGPLLGAASVWATQRLGTLLHGRAAGLIAGVLLLVQPWFLLLHAGYMAHTATILAIALSAVWLLEGETATGWSRTWRWLAVGVAIAIAVTVRTLTGVALGASLGLWLIVRGRSDLGTIVRCAATVIAGALPLAAWFLHYNHVTTGDALTVSYQALHGAGFNLGFGTRGFTGIDAALQRVPLPITFTPRDAVEHLLQRVASINATFVPYALLAPALALFGVHGHRPRWQVAGAFALLPVLYFFYWGSEIRFYSEYLPFLMAWVAGGAVMVMRERPRAGAALLAAIVAGSALLNVPGRWSRIPLDAPWMRSDYTGSPARFAAFDSLEQLQRTHGKLLVFVQEQMPHYDVLIDRLYQYNTRGLESPILVARDLGGRNAELVARFPDRTPYLLKDNGRERAATITPVSRPR